MKTITTRSSILMWTIIFGLSFTACKRDRMVNQEILVAGPDVNLFALTNDNKLLSFNAKAPQSVSSQVTISNLQTGEMIVGIDFRPATGQLYGLGTTNRIYVIDPKTGAARAINSTPFTAVSGAGFGLDFNPTVDLLRLVSSTGQNLRLNPSNGTITATDGVISGPANARIGSVAYTQNRAGASATILFDIDASTDKLYKQDPPNTGALVEIGSLGVDVDETGGFDISADGNSIVAALTANGESSLYTIDIVSGKASKIGKFNQRIIGIAIPTEPVAYAVSSNNELLIFNPANSTPTIVTKAITGIQTGESILGIDMRPATGQLFALGSTSRLYTINASSGVATPVGTVGLTTAIVGTQFGFDFNPTVDRIRIVSNTGQNLRVNPEDAVVIVDGNITLANAAISGAAYTNNFAGATSTALFDIDATNDRLYKQDPPNAGTLVDVGALGINVENTNGFDIGGTSGIAYGIFTVGTTQRLYSINLTSGAATAGATFNASVRGFTLGLGF